LSQSNTKSEDSKEEKPIFEISKFDKNRNELKDGKVLVKEKDTSVSKYNAMKHGLRGQLPLLCNNCDLRPTGVGGIGGCNQYKLDSTCNVRADIRKYNEKFDTRKPEHMKTIVNDQIQLLLERVAFAEFRAGVEGGLLDKATLAQLHTLRDYIKLQHELAGTIKISAEESSSEDMKNTIKSLFRKATVEIPRD